MNYLKNELLLYSLLIFVFIILSFFFIIISNKSIIKNTLIMHKKKVLLFALLIFLSYSYIVIQKKQYPYKFINDFEYEERFEYGMSLFCPKIQYKNHKLTYTIYIQGFFNLPFDDNDGYNLYRDENIIEKHLYLNFEEQKEFLEILKKYNLLDWKKKYQYSDGDASYLIKDEFYSLLPEYTTQYIGLSASEYKYRTDFECWLHINNYKLYRYYDSDALPLGYNEFSEEIWDFVISKTKALDWRDYINEISEDIWQSYHETINKNIKGSIDIDQMWYFLLFEFNDEINKECCELFSFDASLNLYGDNERMYSTYSNENKNNIYYVNHNNELIQFKQDDSLLLNNKNKIKINKYIDNNKRQTLNNLIKKYDILSWNWNDINEISNKNESGKTVFLYIYDKNGVKKKLTNDRNNLPLEYLEFKKELLQIVND